MVLLLLRLGLAIKGASKELVLVRIGGLLLGRVLGGEGLRPRRDLRLLLMRLLGGREGAVERRQVKVIVLLVLLVLLLEEVGGGRVVREGLLLGGGPLPKGLREGKGAGRGVSIQ